MISKELLQAESKELKDQLGKAQQQLYAAEQQTESLRATTERLQGALIMVEKFQAQLESPQQGGPEAASPGSANGAQALPHPAVSA